jgi:hypothetical protein
MPASRRGVTLLPSEAAPANGAWLPFPSVDRRTFLRGTAGLAVAGAFARLDLASAGAQTAPPPIGPVPLQPPANWPPAPGKYDGLIGEWIYTENLLPGSDGWRIGGTEPAGTRAIASGGLTPQAIEGYLDATSARLGQRVGFHVSSVTSTYTIDAYRMGWYQGFGGRLVWRSGPLPGWQQGPPRVDPATNMIEAPWDTTYELTLHGPPFIPGCYLFRLTAADGSARLVPLTIRDDHSRARFVVVNAVADWQAYNEWGGASLYYGRAAAARTFDARARVVSFDRPYDWGLGAADFIGAELPLIMRMEEAALDVTYVTSIDVHQRPDLLKRHKAVLSTAHDEYWTAKMRNGFEAARDSGVNLAFFGANAMFRQVRFEDSSHGSLRHEVCYKSAKEDPVTDKQLTTVNWREAPLERPEASLVGAQYEGLGIFDLEVTFPDAWIWEQTSVVAGQKFAGVMGPEYDRVYPSSPDNIEILARSPFAQGRKGLTHADTTYYSASSGAGVFASGTIGWLNHLEPIDASGAPREPALYHATMNILRLFGAGPAGRARQSVPNRAQADAQSKTADTQAKKKTGPPPPQYVPEPGAPVDTPPPSEPSYEGGGGGSGGTILPPLPTP